MWSAGREEAAGAFSLPPREASIRMTMIVERIGWLRAGAMVLALGLLVAASGCGGSEREETAAPAASATETPSPEPAEAEPAADSEAEHGFEKGHSRAVRDYYREPHSHAGDEVGDTEAEYHRPPTPAAGGIGDAITLTGTGLGVRMRVKVLRILDPVPGRAGAGKRLVGVRLRLVNTGIEIFESELRNAALTYGAKGHAPALLGRNAGCSNGFSGLLRLDVGRRAEGCLLFQVPSGRAPKTLLLALEQVPAEAGGRWRLR
jgi:hypothetical protein